MKNCKPGTKSDLKLLTKYLLVLSLFLLFQMIFNPVTLRSQIPQGFNYQAILRDAGGAILDNKTAPVEFSIQNGVGTLIWQEIPSLTSNQFGLISYVIGSGVRVAGSAILFSDIDWNAQTLYLKTRVRYPGLTWNDMGVTQIWSVPYSLMAKDVEGPVSRLGIEGKTTLPDVALFEVKNVNGETVFAVYNEGVRVYVPDGAKGPKGGFAVSGFSYNKALPENYLYVSPDSIRAYILYDPVVKGAKGGFAVSGFSAAKAAPEEYLRVTRDSTRVYVNDEQKGAKGGFAVSGFGAAKGPVDNFLTLNPENYFIGQGAGAAVTTGLYNSFIGYKAGYRDSTGSYNNFVGYQSGYRNNAGNNNAFYGYQSGYENQSGSLNTYLGNSAGKNNKTGLANTMVGVSAGQNMTEGNYNTFIGSAAGAAFQKGRYNIFIGTLAGGNGNFTGVVNGPESNVAIGTAAGSRLNIGSNNVFLGNNSGFSNTSGADNVFLGTRSGFTNFDGINNNFLGFEAGFKNYTGDNNVFMGTSAGYNNYDGYANVFIGTRSGLTNTSGWENTFIGYEAGYSNSTGVANLFLGTRAGRGNTTGYSNTFLGRESGIQNTTGYGNSFIGIGSGNSNTLGLENTYMGRAAGYSNQTGVGNLMLGAFAGFSDITGDDNTFLGYNAGYALQTGYSNIFIGSYAGSQEINTSNKLFIENTSAGPTQALIYGDFGSNYLRLNANTDIYGNLAVGKSSASAKVDILGGSWDIVNGEGDMRIGNGTYRMKFGVADGGGGAGDARINAVGGTNRLILGGGAIDVMAVTNNSVFPWTNNAASLGLSTNRWTTIFATNGVINTSDSRMKENIEELNYGLNALLQLSPVTYQWNSGPDSKKHIGLIAQDVREVISEVVDEGDNPEKTLGINYSELIPVLIKSIQEQQKQIEKMEYRIKELENQVVEK